VRRLKRPVSGYPNLPDSHGDCPYCAGRCTPVCGDHYRAFRLLVLAVFLAMVLFFTLARVSLTITVSDPQEVQDEQ